MKYILLAIYLTTLFSCQKERAIAPAPPELEDIDTIYAYGHIWIGSRGFVDSAYVAFLNEMFPAGSDEVHKKFIKRLEYSLK